MIRVGFLGPAGTFSHEAVKLYSRNVQIEEVPFVTIPEAISAVAEGIVDQAVVPIENSVEGSINITLDMLSSELDIQIKAELVISIRQNFLIKKGADVKKIKSIYSHPQPIAQCRKYIEANFPFAQIKYACSTAEAALEVVKGDGSLAAIGSVDAANIYDLDIYERDIHDNGNNSTRFVVISKTNSDGNDCLGGTDNDNNNERMNFCNKTTEGIKSGIKTSIVFSTEDKPGSLYKILGIFNLWDINMTKIESRPEKNQLGRYVFFVDILGDKNDAHMEDAILMVRKKTSFYKYLGSYPELRFKE